MTDTTDQVAPPTPQPPSPSPAPAAPVAPVLPPHRPWHHDPATVAVLGLVGGFLTVSLAFGAGWHARAISENVFGGRGYAMHGFAGPGGFGGPGMMRGQGPGFDRGFDRDAEAPYDRQGFAPGGPGRGCWGQGPASEQWPDDPQVPVDPRAPRGGWRVVPQDVPNQ